MIVEGTGYVYLVFVHKVQTPNYFKLFCPDKSGQNSLFRGFCVPMYRDTKP